MYRVPNFNFEDAQQKLHESFYVHVHQSLIDVFRVKRPDTTSFLGLSKKHIELFDSKDNKFTLQVSDLTETKKGLFVECKITWPKIDGTQILPHVFTAKATGTVLEIAHGIYDKLPKDWGHSPSYKKYDVRDFGHVTKWYKAGTNILHRDNGPAVECKNGHKEWWLNNTLHNETRGCVGGLNRINPAIIYEDGSLAYYRHGVLHSDEGPAYRKADGYDLHGKRVYVDSHYCNGILHNLNGPAITGYNNSILRYFVDGIETDQINFPHEVKIYKNITLKTAPCRDYIQTAIEKNPSQFPDLVKIIGDYKKIVTNISKDDLFLVLTRLADKHNVSFKKQAFDAAWEKA